MGERYIIPFYSISVTTDKLRKQIVSPIAFLLLFKLTPRVFVFVLDSEQNNENVKKRIL